MNSALFILATKLILAGIVAIFLYIDARARDYNWFMWTLMPAIVLFSPGIATTVLILIILIMIYLSSRPKGNLIKCPHCKKNIHTVLAFCPFCRNSVKRECLKCHETVEWDATRCPHCKSPNLTDS